VSGGGAAEAARSRSVQRSISLSNLWPQASISASSIPAGPRPSVFGPTLQQSARGMFPTIRSRSRRKQGVDSTHLLFEEKHTQITLSLRHTQIILGLTSLLKADLELFTVK